MPRGDDWVVGKVPRPIGFSTQKLAILRLAKNRRICFKDLEIPPSQRWDGTSFPIISTIHLNTILFRFFSGDSTQRESMAPSVEEVLNILLQFAQVFVAVIGIYQTHRLHRLYIRQTTIELPAPIKPAPPTSARPLTSPSAHSPASRRAPTPPGQPPSKPRPPHSRSPA